MITYYKYVLHSMVADYEAKGWVYDSGLGSIHGFWSVLMRYEGEGEPT